MFNELMKRFGSNDALDSFPKMSIIEGLENRNLLMQYLIKMAGYEILAIGTNK